MLLGLGVFLLLPLWAKSFEVLLILPISLLSASSFFELMFLFDQTSGLFLLVLMLVVGVMSLFSQEYMGGELLESRFKAILNSFIGAMVLLILSSSFFYLLVGWDGLGVTSFMLISFYNTAVSWSSSLKTFLMNRLGDSLVLLALAICMWGGHLNFPSSTYLAGMISLSLLSLGLFTKSAQFPFSAWLPAAMAAPTPVSALVHSSTLVTAGVFLLVRGSKYLDEGILWAISLISVWTVVVASLNACVEGDIKKVMAFSTLSQLGLMVFCASKGLLNLCFFHLVCHALFKAKMFMCAGYYLMGSGHNQDLRGLDLNKSNLSLDLSLLVTILNLNGMAYLTGFYSKDSILDTENPVKSLGIYTIFSFSLVLTVLYSVRILFSLTKFSHKIPYFFSGVFSKVPLYLGVPSLFFGWGVGNYFISPVFSSKAWKVLIPLLFVLGLLVVIQWSSLVQMVWMESIGGLNFFNSDKYLATKSEWGQMMFQNLDKGVLSFPISLGKSNLQEQSSFITSFGLRGILSLILVFMLVSVLVWPLMP